MKASRHPKWLRRPRVIPGLALLVLLLAGTSIAHESKHDAAPPDSEALETDQHMMGQGMGQKTQMMPGMQRLMMPEMDPARGRKLFASKGCVACHSINGVGGHDATPLDAHTMQRVMNPFDLAAKMWSMAPAMIYAQEEALGEQILFTGDELADIIAFIHHDEEQHHFSEVDITPEVRKMMDHRHGEPGGGAEMHGEELGHDHGQGQEGGMHGDE
jgi:cytochrome c